MPISKGTEKLYQDFERDFNILLRKIRNGAIAEPPYNNQIILRGVMFTKKWHMDRLAEAVTANPDAVSQITKVVLSECGIVEFPVDFFANFKRLKHLDLSNNFMHAIPVLPISIESMHSYKIDGNPIPTRSAEAYPDIPAENREAIVAKAYIDAYKIEMHDREISEHLNVMLQDLLELSEAALKDCDEYESMVERLFDVLNTSRQLEIPPLESITGLDIPAHPDATLKKIRKALIDLETYLAEDSSIKEYPYNDFQYQFSEHLNVREQLVKLCNILIERLGLEIKDLQDILKDYSEALADSRRFQDSIEKARKIVHRARKAWERAHGVTSSRPTAASSRSTPSPLTLPPRSRSVSPRLSELQSTDLSGRLQLVKARASIFFSQQRAATPTQFLTRGGSTTPRARSRSASPRLGSDAQE